MILKAGTYRFNDVIKGADFSEDCYGVLQFYFGSDLYSVDNIKLTNITENNIDYVMVECSATRVETGSSMSSLPIYIYPVPDNYVDDLDEYGFVIGLDRNIIVTEDLSTDIPLYVSIINFILNNTNYNEVNAKPLAEITYNGSTIAELNAGETATLSCEGKKMVSDVVVKVNKIEEPKDDSIVGTWVFKSTLSSHPYTGLTIIFIEHTLDDSDYVMQAIQVRQNENDLNTLQIDSGFFVDGYFEGEANIVKVRDGILSFYATKINIMRESTDETFITWLKANATKQ